jgi:hypothetical protein
MKETQFFHIQPFAITISKKKKVSPQDDPNNVAYYKNKKMNVGIAHPVLPVVSPMFLNTLSTLLQL